MKTLKSICIFIMIICTTMVAINFLFQDANTIPLVEQHNMQGYSYYTFNINEYFRNIETSLNDTAELELRLPARQWINITNNILEEQFWEDLGNNLALILDYIIMILNVIIYPLRIGGYTLQQILAFIGLPVNKILMGQDNKLAWMVQVTNVLKALQIPYV